MFGQRGRVRRISGRFIRNQHRLAPDEPFVVYYYAPGATHAPHHPRKE